MPRGRPSKKGLDWYKKDVNYYEDFKISDLLNEYGPLGNSIFDCLLCMIYREGYFIEAPPEKVAMAVIKAIGSRWVKDKTLVLQVIHYCADIGLLHDGLLRQNVFTSAAIQRRYAEATSRNKVNRSSYWLIDENGQPLERIPKSGISATENQVSAAENRIYDAEMQQEKDKEKEEEKEKSRTEKRKSKSPDAPSSLQEVEAYCKKRNSPVNPKQFFDFYAVNDWFDSRGNPVLNWKQKLINWEKDGREAQPKETVTATHATYDLGLLDSMDLMTPPEQEKDVEPK